MILQRSNLIFGIIKTIFVVCFKVVYKVLSLFCMQGVFLLAILGLILQIFGVFSTNKLVLIIYLTVLGFTAIISVCILLRKIFRLDKMGKNNKEKEK